MFTKIFCLQIFTKSFVKSLGYVLRLQIFTKNILKSLSYVLLSQSFTKNSVRKVWVTFTIFYQMYSKKSFGHVYKF